MRYFNGLLFQKGLLRMKKICILFAMVLCTGCLSTTARDVVTLPWSELAGGTETLAMETESPETVDALGDVAEELEEFNEKDEVVSYFMPDLPQSEVVDLYYHYYSQKHKALFAHWLERAQVYLPDMIKTFREKGLPEELVFLPFAESGFNPWAYSRAGAGGMWQFMPRTARGQGLKVDWWLDERRDPHKSTEAAARYLQYLYAEFADWHLVLAAYNAGEGTVRRAIAKSGQRDFFTLATSKKKYFAKETRHYVPKFIAILKILRNLEKLGFAPLNLELPAQTVALPLTGSMNLKELAAGCGVSWKDFTRLNPAFRRSISSPDYNGFVYMPMEKGMLAQKKLETLRGVAAHGVKRYKVRPGESLWAIARKHNAHIQDLKNLNGLKKNLIHPGQWLLVAMDETVSPTAIRKRASGESKRAIALQRANYRVQAGDSLWGIARKFGTSIQTLLVANGLRENNLLQPGQKLYIPDGAAYNSWEHAASSQQMVRYNVRKGDTIWGIAKRFNLSVPNILSWNGMKKDEILRPGTDLVIFPR